MPCACCRLVLRRRPAGVYKPRVRTYDLSQLSMKFERYMDAECVQFEVPPPSMAQEKAERWVRPC